MKKIMFILLTCITCISYSQTYHPLLEIGKRWNVVYWIACFDLNCEDEGHYTTIYKVGYDTLINSKKYYRILSTRDSSLTNFRKGALLHEDTTQKKVYAYKNDSSDLLLYDFLVEQNDTVKITGTYCNRVVVVDSVDTVEIGGMHRKRLHFFSDGDPPEEWIEGIGSTFGLFYPGMNDRCIIDAGYELLCMYNNDSLIYGPSFGGCYQGTLGVSQYLEGSLAANLAPNPVIDHSVLSLSGSQDAEYVIKIISPGGLMQKVYSLKGTGEIDIYNNEYPPGLYIYFIFKNQRIIHAGKFIVQE